MAFAAEPMPVAAPASDAKSLAFLMTCSTWVVATEALVPSARAMSACAKSPMSFNASRNVRVSGGSPILEIYGAWLMQKPSINPVVGVILCQGASRSAALRRPLRRYLLCVRDRLPLSAFAFSDRKVIKEWLANAVDGVECLLELLGFLPTEPSRIRPVRPLERSACTEPE